MNLLLPLLLTLPLCPPDAQQVGGYWEKSAQISSTDSDEQFGAAMAMSPDLDGDGTADLIIGAPGAGVGRDRAVGLVRVISGTDRSTLYEVSGDMGEMYFGSSVAVLGDIDADGISDFAVSAPGSNGNSGLLRCGELFLFSGVDGTELFRIEGVADDDYFAHAIAGVGDLSGDGVPDVLVGQQGSWLTNICSASLISGADGTTVWYRAGDVLSNFAWDVCAFPDYNGDGVEDCLIASPADDTFYFEGGSVEIASGVDGATLATFYGTGDEDFFGYSIASPGDMNGDGTADLLIGAPYAALDPLTFPGYATLLSGSDGSTITQWWGSQHSAQMGFKVAAAGDVNGDGVMDLFMSEPEVPSPSGDNIAGVAMIIDGQSKNEVWRQYGFAEENALGLTFAGGFDLTHDGLPDFCTSQWNPGNPIPGVVSLWRYGRGLEVSATEIPASSASTTYMLVDMPQATAGMEYRILVSRSGVGVTQLGGIDIPLARDGFGFDSYNGDYWALGTHSNMHGTLDASGNGLASVSFAAGDTASLIGMQYAVAAVAVETRFNLPRVSSIAHLITFVL